VSVIAKRTLGAFWSKHKDCEQQLKAWCNEAQEARWKKVSDIRRDCPSACVLPDNRVVFNIKGNQYRLIVRINYAYGVVWIRFIGTHGEYDKINASKI